MRRGRGRTRRESRARTKIRPEHADAVTGRVLTVDRGRYLVLVGEGTDDEREATASRASELRKHAIVTGDLVDVVGDTSGRRGQPVPHRAHPAARDGAAPQRR